MALIFFIGMNMPNFISIHPQNPIMLNFKRWPSKTGRLIYKIEGIQNSIASRLCLALTETLIICYIASSFKDTVSSLTGWDKIDALNY